MAEIGKGVTAGKLASNVQKKLTRAQEKVLQKLGKADETKDTAFEEGVGNFGKQMAEGTKLQKDLKGYLAAVKTMHEASRRLQDCLAEMYEPDWFGKEEVDALAEEMIEKEMDSNLEDTDALWTDYHEKLMEQSLISMDTYLAQFPDIKARIDKRNRKLVDFDSARHHHASLQKNKKKDEVKMAKPMSVLEKAAPGWAQGMLSAHHVAQTNLSRNQAEEELGRAQKVFEEINVELQEELPALWDSRVGFYVNTFQSMAGYQEKFHKEMGKLNMNLNDIMTKLEEQRLIKKGGKPATPVKSEDANHSVTPDSAAKSRSGPPSRPAPRASSPQDLRQEDIIDLSEEASAPGGHAAQAASLDSWERDPQGCAQEEEQGGWDDDGAPAAQTFTQPSWDDEGDAAAAGQAGWDDDPAAPAAPQSYPEPAWDEDEGAQAAQSGGGWGDDGGTQADAAEAAADTAGTTVTNGSEGAELPAGFLYKVKAMHDYAATDGDELDMKAGDAVLVLAFDQPDEQDDGWLIGVKESHWLEHKNLSVKGVFPENFTQKL